MNLTGMMLALICIAMVSALSIGYYGSVQDSYGISVPSSFQGANLSLQSFNRSAKIIEVSERMENNDTGIAKALRGIPIFGEIGSITLAGIQILTLLFETPDMMTDMITDTLRIIGLPPWIGTLIIAGMTILIIMAIVSALVKWGGSG